MSEFLGIDIKTLYNGGFQFCQNGFIRKVLETTGMEHSNGLPTLTKVEAPIGTYINGSESKRGVYISFAVHKCARFTHNTKVSHETAVKRICRYLQGTKENGLVFNPSKTLVVGARYDKIMTR